MDFSAEGILERMRSRLKSEDTKLEGSFSMDNLQAVSEELAMFYNMLIVPAFEKLEEKEKDMATSGNERHYIRWAKEAVDGSGNKIVGNAKVKAVRDGTGLVTVAILTTEAKSPTTEQIKLVQDYIDSNKPIGAKPQVVAATGIEVNIDCTLSLKSGFSAETIKDEIIKVVGLYFVEVAFWAENGILNYYKVSNLISGINGVNVIESLTINGNKENIEIDYDKFFLLKGVVVNGT